MATDPSSVPTNTSSHGRKISVIPALPLSLSDRTWRRPNLPPAPKTTSSNGVRRSSTSSEQIPSTSKEQNQVQVASDVLEPSSPKPHPPVSETEPSTQDVPHGRTLPETNDEQIQKTDGLVTTSETNVAEEPIDRKYESQTSESTVLPPALQDEHKLEQSQVDDTLDAPLLDEERRVRMAEEETQPSEHGASSIEPSSTTGLTDYGSAAESTLETVVPEARPLRSTSGVPHRKSEVAPEALTNGFSSHSAHASNASQPSAEVVALPPRAKPTPMPSILDHLLFLANTKEYFDVLIYVNQPNQAFPPSEHVAHSLMLSRSAELIAKLPASEEDGQSRVLNLFPVRNVMPHAFEAALRFFYSDHILTAQALIPQAAHQDRQAKEHTLEYIMSYWIAGVELGLNPIKARAYDLVKDMLDWDLAEMVAREIQDLRVAEETLTNNNDKVEVRDIANSLSRLLAQLFATRLNVAGFVLDTSTQPSSMPSRFAQLEYPRSNNPALSTVVFGSLPSAPTHLHSPLSSASTILLNINFWDLRMLADQLLSRHGADGARVIAQVLEVREERREQIVSNRAIPNKARLANSTAWDVAGWKEYINEHGHLSRERIGFMLPSKSH